MDLDQLHTFLEIVRLKSFSKAAQTCYRTQPAISAQVRQLEQELNTTLFERLGTRIALTTAGKIFAEFAEQHASHLVFFQVHGDAGHVVREGEQFAGHDLVQAVHARARPLRRRCWPSCPPACSWSEPERI